MSELPGLEPFEAIHRTIGLMRVSSGHTVSQWRE